MPNTPQQKPAEIMTPETEIFMMSYPKTGRTWLRALVGKSLCELYGLPEAKILDTAYLTTEAGLSVTAFSHDGAGMRQLKPYTELNPDKSDYHNKKVLLLSRDIHDTLVSAYFQATKRINVFEGTISRFIRTKKYGAIKIITFYRQWYEARTVPEEFQFVRYEDMHLDPAAVLKKTLVFMGVTNPDEKAIKTAIEYSSFENLRKAEIENRFGNEIMAPGNTADPDSFKVRQGKVGKYVDHLSAEDIAYIDQMNSELGCEFTRNPG